MAQKTVLIAGSRVASPELLARVRGGVLRVWYRRDELIVGDALGVDEHAMKMAEWLNLPYMAYGIWRLARNKAKRFTNVRSRLNGLSNRLLYRGRDEYMVLRAHVVLCFWNFESKGTKHVYDFACNMAKEAYLIGEAGLIRSNVPVPSPTFVRQEWEQVRV